MVLLAEIRKAQAELGERVDRRGIEPVSPQPIIVDLDRFAASLRTAWRDASSPVPSPQADTKRPSMLDELQDQVRAWLDGEPTISALEVLRLLKLICPDRFNGRHLRTVQRAVKAWTAHPAD